MQSPRSVCSSPHRNREEGPLLGLCRWRCGTPNTQRANMEDTAMFALFAVFFVLGVVLAVMFGSSPAPVPTRTPIVPSSFVPPPASAPDTPEPDEHNTERVSLAMADKQRHNGPKLEVEAKASRVADAHVPAATTVARADETARIADLAATELRTEKKSVVAAEHAEREAWAVAAKAQAPFFRADLCNGCA